MKLKNALYIISLFSICAVEAKITGGRPGVYQPGVTPPGSPVPYVPAPGAPAAPKPAPVKNQFQSLLYTIRNSNQNNVINANGEIVAKIIDDIQNSDLAQEQKQALLQAAVTVKMPLTVANNADTAGIINNAMAQVAGSVGKGKEQETQPEKILPKNFYNPETYLLDENYLRSRIKDLPASLTDIEKTNLLTKELFPLMQDQWDNEGVLLTGSYKKTLGSQLRKQISDMVPRVPSTQSSQQVIIGEKTARTPFYNDKTNLMDNEYLTKLVNERLYQGEKPENIAQDLFEEYQLYMVAEWRNRNVQNRNQLMEKLRQQIQERVFRPAGKQMTPGQAQKYRPGEIPPRKQTPAQKKSNTEELFAVPKPQGPNAEEVPAMQKPEGPDAKAIAKDIVNDYRADIETQVIELPDAPKLGVISLVVGLLLEKAPHLKQTNADVVADLIIDAYGTGSLKEVDSGNIRKLVANALEKIQVSAPINYEELQALLNGLVKEPKYVNNIFDTYGNPVYQTVIDIATRVVQKYPQFKNKANAKTNIHDLLLRLVSAIAATGKSVTENQKQVIGGMLTSNWNNITG